MKIAARAAMTVALAAALIARPLPAGAYDDASGTSRETVDMGGWDRSYLLHVPPGPPARRPLIVALHGGLNDAEYVRRQSGLDEVADEAGYAVAYPDGFLGTWNAGGQCEGKQDQQCAFEHPYPSRRSSVMCALPKRRSAETAKPAGTARRSPAVSILTMPPCATQAGLPTRRSAISARPVA